MYGSVTMSGSNGLKIGMYTCEHVLKEMYT